MWKFYKSPGVGQILIKLIEAGDKILLSVIHKVINFIGNNDELPQQ
jgi:hypothetical protein